MSTNYVDPVQIQAGAPAGLGQVAVDLADRNIPTIPVFSDPGAPRGDPTDNDNYFCNGLLPHSIGSKRQ